MAKITAIPFELLSVISEQGTLTDVLNLRLVCKVLSEALISKALGCIVIKAPKGSLSVLTSLAHAGESHAVWNLARTVILEPSLTMIEPQQRREALSFLHAICSKFSQVVALTWLASSSIQPASEDMDVVTALHPMLASLRKLELHGFNSSQSHLLSRVSQLTHLTLESGANSVTVEDSVWNAITLTVARSSQTLEELKVLLRPTTESVPIPTIQHVLSLNGAGFPVYMALKSVSLCIGIRSTSTTLPQISSLRCLTLTQGDHDPEPLDEDNIFIALKRSHVQLQQISVPITKPVLDYLTSYEDVLQDVKVYDHVKFNRSFGTPPPQSQSLLASRFFREVVPKHSSSLKRLVVNARFDDGWPFGKGNEDVFLLSFPEIEHIAIPVSVTDDMTNHLETILNRVLHPTHFPNLLSVGISSVVRPAEQRGLVMRCGNPIVAHARRSRKAALSRLRKYTLIIGEGQGELTGWRPPFLYIERIPHEFYPCLSGRSLHYEPYDTTWDNVLDPHSLALLR